MAGRLWLLLFALLVMAPCAHAQSDPEVERARELGYAGLGAYHAGNFAEAQVKLDAAYALLEAPSLGLYTARTMRERGLWVEASERYLEVARLEVTFGDVELQEEARATAAAEQQELWARIPTLTITVEEGGPLPQVTLNGAALRSEILGVALPLNPGAHEVVATWQTGASPHPFTLKEGQVERLTLRASAPAAPPPAAPPLVAPPAEPVAPTPPPPREPTRGTGPLRTMGWVAAGVGLGGLTVSILTGYMALDRKQALDDSRDCTDTRCGPSQHDAVDSYNLMRDVSAVSALVGAASVLTGALMIAFSDPIQEQPEVALWVGPKNIRLLGRF